MTLWGHAMPGRAFEPLLETHAAGFTHNGREFGWDQIEEIEVDSWPRVVRLLVFVFSFGNVLVRSSAWIHVRGVGRLYVSELCLVKGGEIVPRKVRWGLLRDSADFTELIELLRQKHRQCGRPGWPSSARPADPSFPRGESCHD